MFQMKSAPALAYGTPSAAETSVGERLNFLKKVYGLLGISLMSATVGAFAASGPLLMLVANNMMLFFVLEIALIFFATYAAQKPVLNMVALFSFTTVSGMTVGPLLYRFGPTLATQAFLLTAITFVSLSVYVVTSKKDFSFLSGFLVTGLVIAIVGGLLNMFLFQSSMLHFMMSGITVFLFSGFILYDTSNILRNYSTDDYVSATLALYLDVLNLFVALLNLLGVMSSRD